MATAAATTGAEQGRVLDHREIGGAEVILSGGARELHQKIAAQHPGIPKAPPVRLQLLDYQMAALFALARRYNRAGARILEIGTGQGGSGYMLSRAAPDAQITSLTTSPAEQQVAEALWRAQKCGNVTCLVAASWDFLASTTETYDLVFVDGDHNRIVRDLPWFDRVRTGGLFLCHDYSPQDSRSPSRIVYEELNKMAAGLGRDFDVRIVDEVKIGMAGFYRRSGERLAPGEQSIEKTAPAPAMATGIVLRQDSADARAGARAGGTGIAVADDWTLPWPRTLFVAPEVSIPWDLLAQGFDLLSRWDVAAPLSGALAQDLGTLEERDETKKTLLDLRVPAYHPGLVFVRDSEAGRSLLQTWREECGRDEALAFLRALVEVKPLFCALPRVWLADPGQRLALNKTASKRGRRR
jgi:predicted O-methyltransferase YrrM